MYIHVYTSDIDSSHWSISIELGKGGLIREVHVLGGGGVSSPLTSCLDRLETSYKEWVHTRCQS